MAAFITFPSTFVLGPSRVQTHFSLCRIVGKKKHTNICMNTHNIRYDTEDGGSMYLRNVRNDGHITRYKGQRAESTPTINNRENLK
jgi:hypothetical protein